MSVDIVPVSDLRRDTALLIQRANEGPVYITQYGRPKAVLVGYEAYERLMAQLEDLADLACLQERADEPARPFGEFLQELDTESA